MRRAVGLLALTLGGVSVVSLVRVVSREPDYGRPPRLAAAVDDGPMEEFLETREEKAAILAWVERGAPEEGWSGVSAVFEARCIVCHHSGGAPFEMLALDRYQHAAAAAVVRPVLEEKITGGTMGEYLESAEERDALVDWMAKGAPEKDWPHAREILAAHCVQCHNPDGVAGIPRLDRYVSVQRLARLPEPRAIPLGSYATPGIGLVASMLVAGLALRPTSSTSSPVS